MSRNRVGITLRFNEKEVKDLNALVEFWNREPKEVLKTAFYQFVIATNQLQNKLNAAEQAKSQETEQCQTESSSLAQDSPAEQQSSAQQQPA